MKNPNITGIIQSIIWLVDCCRGSALGIVVIFCMMNIDAPTRTGSKKGSGTARSNHRNELFSGTTSCTQGTHE